MSLVTVKRKYQVVIPQEIREQLGISEGDILEAQIENGRLVYVPKVVIDRDAAFKAIDEIADKSKAAWQADGKTEEDIEELISETIQEIRADS